MPVPVSPQPRTMRAAVLKKPATIDSGPLAVGLVPVPVPPTGQVLVRVHACGICRTDLHVVEGDLPERRSPVIPGHQVVGVVEDRKSTRLNSSHRT